MTSARSEDAVMLDNFCYCGVVVVVWVWARSGMQSP